MRKIIRKILVLMVALIHVGLANAQDVVIDGLSFHIYSNGEAQISSPDEGNYSGDIVIPEKITYNGITYPVTRIGGYAFCYDYNITSVNIPQTVTEIGVNAFLSCRSLKSITIPKSVKTIGPVAFEGCTGLKTITFEEGADDLVFEKHTSALVSENFRDSPIDTITLGRNIVSQDATSPFGKLNPIKVLIIKNIDAIKSNSYRGLEDTPLVIVPTEEDISKVKNYFQGNIYPGDVAYAPILKQSYLGGFEFTLWDNIYDNKQDSITDVIVGNKSLTPNEKGIYYIDGLMPDSTYEVSIHSSYEKTVITKVKYPRPDGTAIVQKVSKIVTICDTINTQFKTIEPSLSVTDWNIITQTTYKTQVFASEDKTLSPSEKGVYLRTYYSQEEWVKYKADSTGMILATSLVPNEEYHIRSYAIYNGIEYIDNNLFKTITTKPIKPFTNKKSPYSVNHIDLSVSSGTLDSDLSVVELGVQYRAIDYPANSEKIVTIENLTPGQQITIYPYVVVKYASTEETKKVIGEAQTYTSSTPYIRYINCDASATTIKVDEMEYELYDGTFKECGFSTPYAVVGDKAFFTGLNPGEKYDVTGYLIIEEGDYKVTLSRTVTTPALKLTTFKAKATSNSKAVICAETNIANEETGTGFEWRRIDAPDLVPSEEVACAVHDGVMEGILNNLSANTYYKYRPFYKSASGKMYYGEWIGFGTADAYVYFTPTVHTYATAGIANNSVTLNGYALAGSDDILEQGFEYWTDGFVGTRAAGEVMTVAATGQRMSITLNDLQYNTTYRYRAYVKTAKETTYGEEMSFTTGADPAGIGEVAAEDLEVEVRTVQGGIELRLTGEPATARYALYTLNGTSIANGQLTSGEEWQRAGDASLPQGLYLLRVENNKLCRTVKVMVKQ